MIDELTAPAEMEIRQRLETYAQGKSFHLNDDAGMANSLVKALAKRREKFGHEYCPCRRPSGDAAKDREIVCPCAFHLEELERDGHCHCYLFVKEQRCVQTEIS